MAEALNGTFKAELIYQSGPWKTRADAEVAIYEWISWYNHARIQPASEMSRRPSTKRRTTPHSPTSSTTK